MLRERVGVSGVFLPAGWIGRLILAEGLAGLLLLGLPLDFLFSPCSGVCGGLPGASPGDLGDWGTLLTRCISNGGMSSGSGTASSWCQGVLLPPGWISFGLIIQNSQGSSKMYAYISKS